MNIILEGIDASGKSTLAKALSEKLPSYRVQPSEGPEKEAGEILARIMRYDRMMSQMGVIFDRHPIISHPIYSQGTHWMTAIPRQLAEDFYTRPLLVIYCRPTERGFDAHEVNEGESPDHLLKVKNNYRKWLDDYDAWAVKHAHMIYNCGYQFDETVARILKVVL